MIRFGVVLAVVVVAIGLLVGGILTSSLLLVYLAIGVSALAAVLLVIGVVIWRDEIFGEAAVGRAQQPAVVRPGGGQAGARRVGCSGRPGRAPVSAARPQAAGGCRRSAYSGRPGPARRRSQPGN